MGGKVDKGLVFPFLYSKTFLGFICSFIFLGSPHWRRLLRLTWTARRSNQSILKEINPEY